MSCRIASDVGGTHGEYQSSVAPKEGASTILVIDDDPLLLHTVQSLLGKRGFKVLSSSSGPKGLLTLRYTGDGRELRVFCRPQVLCGKTFLWPPCRELNKPTYCLQIQAPVDTTFGRIRALTSSLIDHAVEW